jgi:catechol 2,3-dioxygenase-like lactoylglutathione lyase family enzyme
MNLNQVTLPSRDVPRGAAFYVLLGLRIIVDSSPRYVRLELPEGDATLSLELVERPPSDPGVHVYFECEDLDARVATLQASGVELEELPTDRPWLWREAWLRDPDGNRICLFRAGENRRNPPWRLAPGSG